MSTEEENRASAAPAAPRQHALEDTEAMPTPPMLWLLIPAALLGVLAFLSRN